MSENDMAKIARLVADPHADETAALRARNAEMGAAWVKLNDENTALHARVAKLEAALRFLREDTKWKSVDKDNMEFEGRVTCYQLDQVRAALKDAPQ